MKYLCFWVLLALTFLNAAEPVAPSPLLLPIELKPFIDMFVEATAMDENGNSKKTLREVRSIAVPIREKFYETVNIETLTQLVIDFNERITALIDIYERKTSIERKKNPNQKYLGYVNFVLPVTHLQRLNAISGILYSIDSFNELFFLKKTRFDNFYDYSDKISIALNFSKEVLDEYCPIEMQKIMFPFYMVSAIRAVFKTCDLILDEEKQGYFSVDDEKKPLVIIDVTDKLNLPFFESFDVMLTRQDLKFMHCTRQRLIENINFMLSEHVKFIGDEE